MMLFRNIAARAPTIRQSVLIAAVSSVFLPERPALSDQIVVRGENFARAEVLRLVGGLLQFRGDDGAVRSAHLADADLLIVDRRGFFDDFNEAERLLDAGQPEGAIVRYRRARRFSTEFWADLISARLIVAHDRAQQIDKAVHHLIRVARGQWAGPVAASRLIPRNLPDKRTGRLARALRELDAALATHPQHAQRMILEVTRYELLRRISDEQARRAADRIAANPIPAEIQNERLYDVLVSVMADAVSGNPAPGVTDGLDRAIAECPQRHLPDFLLLKGEVLSRAANDRKALMRASWPFLRVAIHMPADPRAGRGLLGAAKVLRALDNREGAQKLLAECLAHQHTEPSVASEARRLLDDIRAGR